MKGGFRLKTHGFTIIEVMIVLAVSGALFVSAALMIAGRQRQTEFNVAIREVQTQIQQTLSEVSTGQYPSGGDFQCTAGPSGPTIVAGVAGQGTNSDCILLGKVIHFGVLGTNPEQFTTYTVAGLRLVGGAGSQEVQTLAQAKPTVVPLAIAGSTDRRTLRGNLKIVNCPTCTLPQTGAVALITTLASYGAGGSINSGSQQVNLMPVTGSTYGASEAAMVATINSQLPTSSVAPAGGVTACFVGADNRSGLITIGSNGRQLSVKLDIKGNATCS